MAQADMFLKIDGSRQGAIKGEAKDAGHREEIDVLGWTWGLEGNLVHGSNSVKTAVRELKLIKRVDRATTGLMSALRANEVIRKAVLTVRKAGSSGPVEYYTISMEKGRVTAVVQQSGDGADPSALTEEVSIAFSKVAVEYRPQGDDGLARGASSFEMDVFEGDR
jgi:type VI secretion system secreted protein Hcp